MGNATFFIFIFAKNIKKNSKLSFHRKSKNYKCICARKNKTLYRKLLNRRTKLFKKKYSFEIIIFSNQNFIIPEYKIDLLNKSKKLVKSIENINSIILKKEKVKRIKEIKIKENKKTTQKIKKTKTKKKIRTLWVRRKKKN